MNQFVRFLLGVGLALTEPRKRHETRDRLADQVDELADHAARTYGHAVDRIGRLYRSARGDDHRVLTYAVSFLVGAGVGAGAGLLFAPASGAETRGAIAEKVQRFQDDVRERIKTA